MSSFNTANCSLDTELTSAVESGQLKEEQVSPLQHSYNDFFQVKRSHLMVEELCSGDILNVYLFVVKGNPFFFEDSALTR